jgi:hypothetical protein
MGHDDFHMTCSAVSLGGIWEKYGVFYDTAFIRALGNARKWKLPFWFSKL